MQKPLAVLNIEDSESDSDLIARLLKKAGYKITFNRVETAAQMRTALKKRAWDIIISDHSLPQFNSYAALALLKEEGFDIPFITVSGQIGEEAVVDMLKAGANDFLIKDNLTRLIPAVERELEHAKARRERRQAEEQLHESEERFSKIFYQSPIGIVLADAADNSIRAVNDALLEIIGLTREQVVGQNALRLNVQVDPVTLAAMRRELREHGRFRNQEVKLCLPGGEIRDVLNSGTLVTINGKSYHLAILEDVTERKQMEQVLSQSEERLRQVWETTSDAMVLSDSNGIVLAANPAYFRLYGYPSEQIIDRSFTIIFPEEIREQAVEQYKAIFVSENIPPTFEAVVRRADGSERLVESRVSFLTEAGRRMAMLSTIRDITERKQAEVALRERERKLSTLFEILPVGIAILDAERKVSYVNSAQEKILELSKDALQKGVYGNRKYLNVAGAPMPADEFPSARVLKEQQAIYDIETGIVKEDGNIIWTNVSAVPVDFPDWKVVIVTSDITERKRAEEETRQRLSELQALYEMSNTISAEHDLNTLLQTIVENARRLLNSGNSSMYLHLPTSEVVELTVDTERNRALGTRLHLGEGMAGRVAQTRLPLRVNDYSTWEGRSLLYAGISTRAVLEVPMLYKGELIGVLSADEVGESTRKFTEADERLLSLFASQAAGAIHSARLREETILRLSELEVLYQSGLALSQLVDPQAIAQKIIDLLDQKMDWHHTAIRLYHPETEMLELLAFNQPGLKDEEQRRAMEQRYKTVVTRAGQGLSGWVIQHGVAVRSRDLKNDSRYVEIFPGMRSGLYVPIKIAERVIGAISIESERADAFNESDQRLTVTLAAQAAIAIDNAKLFDDLQHSNTDLTSAYDAAIQGWSAALDLRDKETEGHSRRVTEMTVKLAQTMGIDEFELMHIRHGALLHDIGKLGVPDNILLKPGKLTDEEWEIMRKHPAYAHDLLSSIAYLKPALDIPYCHHEKWDGTGYPRGLKGEQIPLAARIFAVVDVWDALTSDRPYRPAWIKAKALKHIKEGSGKHFDPQVLAAFLKMIAN